MDKIQWLNRFNSKKSNENGLSGVNGNYLEYDYYVVYVKNTERSEDEYLFTGYELGMIQALKFTGSFFNEEVTLNPADISDEQFNVQHWYKGYQFIYTGLEQLNKENTNDKKQAKVTIRNNQKKQAQFNKKPLMLSSRQKMLEALTNIYFEGNMREPVHTVLLLTRLHGVYWMHHPDGNAQISKTTFFLNSLVASGDLKLLNTGSYEPNPKALATLEDYKIKEKQDEMERRNKTWTLFWSGLAVIFTLLSALGTLVQAGLMRPFKLL